MQVFIVCYHHFDDVHIKSVHATEEGAEESLEHMHNDVASNCVILEYLLKD